MSVIRPAPNGNDPGTVVAEVMGRVQLIAQLANKIVFVYDDSDLADKIKGVKTFPAVGIIYDGMRSVPERGPSARVGLSAEVVISIVLVMQPETLFQADAKTPVIDLLTLIRNSMMATRSVTGHFWHFLVEAPADTKSGLAFWVQRWSVPIQLPPAQILT
jgi:hypothetical protein